MIYIDFLSNFELLKFWVFMHLLYWDLSFLPVFTQHGIRYLECHIYKNKTKQKGSSDSKNLQSLQNERKKVLKRLSKAWLPWPPTKFIFMVTFAPIVRNLAQYFAGSWKRTRVSLMLDCMKICGYFCSHILSYGEYLKNITKKQKCIVINMLPISKVQGVL